MSPSKSAAPSVSLSSPESEVQEAYAVLANLSAGYSPLEGRLPMYSSPVRRFTSVLLRLLARLACIRRAASVRSEPGSNSHKGVLEFGPRATTSIHLTPCSFIALFSCQRTAAFVTRAVHFTPCTEACQGTLLPNYGRVFPKTACPHRTLARGQQAGSTSTIEQAGR